MTRQKLKAARQAKKLTQRQVADYLGISEHAYQKIENGGRIGKVETWDKLEDLFKTHQRELRKISSD